MKNDINYSKNVYLNTPCKNAYIMSPFTILKSIIQHELHGYDNEYV